MNVYIIRHAIAAKRSDSKYPDDSQRPLVKKGTNIMKKVASRLKKIGVSPDIIISSPYTRAIDTARILKNELGKSYKIMESNLLEPDTPPVKTIKHLSTLDFNEVALVGHDPSLSLLVQEMVSPETSLNLVFKKAGVCLIEFENKPAPGAGTLKWLIAPKVVV